MYDIVVMCLVFGSILGFQAWIDHVESRGPQHPEKRCLRHQKLSRRR